jgi:tryptophan synthase alpha chain
MIAKLFKKKKPFIGFITAGDGGVDYCVKCALQLIAGGVDILEIGFPFSDPVADGMTIQQSSSRALKDGVDGMTVLDVAKRICKQSNIPLILFTYLNPLLQQGASYLRLAKRAGFDAVIVVDLSPSEAHEQHYEMIKKSGLQPIYLISPSTSEARIQFIANVASGFIYYACQKGTTGVRKKLPPDIQQRIALIKKYTDLPVVVGFGIADRYSAQAALQFADGVVVGSAFVHQMGQKRPPAEFKHLAQSLYPRDQS